MNNPYNVEWPPFNGSGHRPQFINEVPGLFVVCEVCGLRREIYDIDQYNDTFAFMFMDDSCDPELSIIFGVLTN